MKLVAYDIDGVLAPDFAHHQDIEENISYETMIKARGYMMPLFQPQGKYILMTARSVQTLDETNSWIARTFIFKPIELVQTAPTVLRTIGEQADYKIQQLAQRPNITHFVESDHAIARLVKEALPHLKVHTFDVLIRKALLKI